MLSQKTVVAVAQLCFKPDWFHGLTLLPPREYFPGYKEGSKSDKIASKDILLLFNQCKGLAYYFYRLELHIFFQVEGSSGQ